MRTTGTPRASSLPRRAAAAGVCLSLMLVLGACSKSSKTGAPPGCTGKPTAMLEKGLALQLAGNTSDAQRCYQAVIAVDPQNNVAFYDLGLIYDNAGQTSQAETDYRQAISIAPTYDPALYNLGRLVAKGNPTEAVGLYQRAIASNPKDAKAHFNLGLLYRAQKKTAQGNAEVQTAVDLDPTLKAGAISQGVPLSGK